MTPRILVVHMGGIGDFLCTLPALAIRSTSAHIEVAGIPERARLAELAGISQASHDLEDIAFHTVFSAPNQRLRDFAARFDQAYVWMDDLDGTIVRNLVAAGIPDVHCFPGVPPEAWNRHAIEWYADGFEVEVSLPVAIDFGQVNADFDVVIQPGSGSPTKNWPLEHFQSLAEILAKEGHRVGWCCGPAETAFASLHPALPDMALVELAPVLAGTKVFIGNDSGITHLASLAGCPTVAIFGPTNPTVWRPAGIHTTVVHGEVWPLLETVQHAVLAHLR